MISFIVIQFGAMFWFLSRGRKYIIYPGEFDVGFGDVRGQSHIVDSTKEVLRLFRGYKEFRKIGGYPPHGILFEGPPGTGKTLLAKAIAGESGVPFMYCSGTAFQSMFMGMSALTVRSFFKKARRKADAYGGVVLFLAEIDALGSRGGNVAMARDAHEHALTPPEMRLRHKINRIIMGGMGMGGDRSVLNEILTQLDGMEGMVLTGVGRHVRRFLHAKPKQTPHYNILIIGATNMASALDPALLRPGRFDRKIHFGNPPLDGRKDIIQYYLDKVHHEPIDVEQLANATKGYSPARIKNIINEGLIFAQQDGRSAVTYDDIWQAKLNDEIGLKEFATYTPWEKEATAIHEAGHAVARWFFNPNERPEIITVEKRGGTLGLVWSQELEEQMSETRSEMLADIKVSLAGIAAERLWYGESTSGPGSDLESATMRAAVMVGYYGMGSSLVSAAVLKPFSYNGEDELSRLMKIPSFRADVEGILNLSFEEVTDLLRRKAHCIEALRDMLVARDQVTGEEFEELMRHFSEGLRSADSGAFRRPPKVLAAVSGAHEPPVAGAGDPGVSPSMPPSPPLPSGD